MAIRVIKGTVRHNGKNYEVDDVVELNGKEEERLINLGVASFHSQVQEDDNGSGENGKDDNKSGKENDNRSEKSDSEGGKGHDEYVEVPDVTELTVEEIKEQLEQVDDLEMLQGMLDLENESGNPRKSAISAIEDRIADLEEDE